MTGIYQIKNKVNGKIYIGQSIDIEKRLRHHYNTAYNEKLIKYNYPLYKAIRKYGIENFEFSVLEECIEEELQEKEREYFNLLKPNYNLADPNLSSIAHNKEVRKKISEALTGRTLSPEHVENNRLTRLGSKNVFAKKVIGTNKRAGEVVKFDCYGDAAEYLIKKGLTKTTRRGAITSISRVVTGERKTYLGFI